jgi:hypothetical protein
MTRFNTPSASRNKGGRPAKFGEPSRPITVTLPLRILDALASLDADRAKAIVKSVEFTLSTSPTDPLDPTPILELPIDDDEALLAVADNRLLRRIPWLSLIEVAPGRHLISLKAGTPLEKLEVTLGDFLDAPGDATPAEINFIARLLERLRTPRRNRALRHEAILIIRNAPCKVSK